MAVSQNAMAGGCLMYQGQLATYVPNPTTSNMALSAPNTGTVYSLPVGTFYLCYTYVNQASTTQETAPTPVQTVTTTANTNNIRVDFTGGTPPGVTAVRTYIGTSPTTMRLYTTSSSFTGGLTFAITALPPDTNQLAPTSSNIVPQVLYTALPASANVTSPSATAFVKDIVLTNTTSAAAKVSLYVVASGDSASTSNQILTTCTIPAYDTKFMTGLNLMLSPGSTIQAAQDIINAVTVTICGLEVS